MAAGQEAQCDGSIQVEAVVVTCSLKWLPQDCKDKPLSFPGLDEIDSAIPTSALEKSHFLHF